MKRTVAGKVNNRLIRIGYFCAYCGSVSISHSSETAACKEVARLNVTYILRRPHLMLSDVSDVYRVLSCRRAGIDYYLMRLEDILTVLGYIIVLFPLIYLSMPFIMLCRLYKSDKL